MHTNVCSSNKKHGVSVTAAAAAASSTAAMLSKVEVAIVSVQVRLLLCFHLQRGTTTYVT